MCTMTDSIAELAVALAKAQASIASAAKDKQNPHFRSSYADLASVWEACRGPLTANGLSVVQSPSTEDRAVRIETILMHSSGQYIRSSLSIPLTKGDAQAIGSAITYGRRYALSAMVGVAPDDDDDGNSAVGRDDKGGPRRERKQAPPPRREPSPPPPVAAPQRDPAKRDPEPEDRYADALKWFDRHGGDMASDCAAAWDAVARRWVVLRDVRAVDALGKLARGVGKGMALEEICERAPVIEAVLAIPLPRTDGTAPMVSVDCGTCAASGYVDAPDGGQGGCPDCGGVGSISGAA